MNRIGKIALVAGLVGGSIGLSAGVAEAGISPRDDSLAVTYLVRGPNAQDVLLGLEFEAYAEPGTGEPIFAEPCSTRYPDTIGSTAIRIEAYEVCPEIGYGTFRAGVNGAPAGWDVFALCTDGESPTPGERIGGDGAVFTLYNQGGAFTGGRCTIYVTTPILLVEKTVVGGPLATSDFTIEVFTDTGDPVATVVDPSPEMCVRDDGTVCGLIALTEGDYTLGEASVYGYVASSTSCTQTDLDELFRPLFVPLERFEDPLVEFSTGGSFQGGFEDAICEVTNTYVEAAVVVSKVVVNDDGGTATAADFTAEVFRTSDGVMATSSACGADGACIDTDLPIGEYQIGESGPAGYTRSVSCAVAAELDVIDSADAVFTLNEGDTVTCTITNNDIAPTTTTTITASTTTTTSTLAPPTTVTTATTLVPPTTTLAPPTTAFNAGAATLPQTGTSSTANSWMAMSAVMLIAAGGVMLLARRRSA